MAKLTQAEIDVLTCMVCANPADVVIPSDDDSNVIVSLCADCVQEMHDFVSATKVH